MQAHLLDIHVKPLEFNAPVFDLPKMPCDITAVIERWEKHR
ncbi:hypothetical protein [Haemophilus parainfluenzae]|nr:hypothetical protein [Haemophilus parainfluenzae]